jgi:hypothetical protein
MIMEGKASGRPASNMSLELCIPSSQWGSFFSIFLKIILEVF